MACGIIMDLVGALVVVALGALDDFEEAVAVVGDALEGGVDAVFLPRVFQRQDRQQQVQVRPQFVRVRKRHLEIQPQTMTCSR